MAGFVRFLVFFVGLPAVFVLVILPLLLSPLLTQMARDIGLRADSLQVTVEPLDPLLIVGRARRVSLQATGVDNPPGRIGSVRLTLGNASYFDRSFETVSGELTDVEVTVGGETLSASLVTIDGPAAAAGATARLSAPQTEHLVRVAAGRAGLTVDSVRVTERGVTVALRGRQTSAGVSVRGGALLLEPEVGGSIVLLQPAPSDPLQFEEAWISSDGLNIRGRIDVARLVSQLGG